MEWSNYLTKLEFAFQVSPLSLPRPEPPPTNRSGTSESERPTATVRSAALLTAKRSAASGRVAGLLLHLPVTVAPTGVVCVCLPALK